MGIKIIYGFDKDDKPELNTDKSSCRYFITYMVKVMFIDDASGKILFTYAPKMSDELLFNKIFQLIKDYDVKRKDITDLIRHNEARLI